ncbi:cytidylate kinase [Rhodopirellula rubra]|uniref:Cytidylate kinase n=1 Tax=Aporhodopirellula rubra TaxID=980271 RepID=A0A7W5E5X4_9BACT|nr:cytidylate kinase [Aporhodopirellula rubra]
MALATVNSAASLLQVILQLTGIIAAARIGGWMFRKRAQRQLRVGCPCAVRLTRN